jgi:hypothetical protein
MLINKLISLTFLIIMLLIENSYEQDYPNEDSPNPMQVWSIFDDIISGQAPTTFTESYITTQVKYNPRLRPIGIYGKNKNIAKTGALIIQVILSLRQVVTLDEKNQILTTSFYLLLSWNDPRLSWKPENYNGIKTITVPASNFWLPDLAILNAVSTNNLITYSPNQNAIINYDGTEYLTLSFASQSTRCKLNVYNYPFDVQKCQIVIGSWMGNYNEINFQSPDEKPVDLKSYINHSIWTLRSIKDDNLVDLNRFNLYNLNLNGNLNNPNRFRSVDIKFELELKRNPLYIMINGIFPCFILNYVILLAFAVPLASQVTLC